MENVENIQGFSFIYENNDKINKWTNHYKTNENWQSYRVAVVMLLPCPLIKIIYHLATGIFSAAISGSGEIALHRLKWMCFSWYQDLKEFSGHLVLLIPFCNDIGYTMVVSALAYKDYYDDTYDSDMQTFKVRHILSIAYSRFSSVLHQFDEAIDAFKKLDKAHRMMIEKIEEGITDRKSSKNTSLQSYENGFRESSQIWTKIDLWEHNRAQFGEGDSSVTTTFINRLESLKDKWYKIWPKIKEAKGREKVSIGVNEFLLNDVVNFEGEFKIAINETYTGSKWIMNELTSDETFFESFQKNNIKPIETILDNMGNSLNCNLFYSFIEFSY